MNVRSAYNGYGSYEASPPRQGHGGSSQYVMVKATSPDSYLPDSYTDPSGDTYRKVNYGTLNGGAMYVKNTR
jgi:hypothetical protein